MSLSCGFHLTAKPVSFGRGQSAVHTAAYNAREQLYQELEGRSTRNYSNHDGEVLFAGIFAPKGAPDWVQDRQELWNRAEAAERQKVNGQSARNVIAAFPHELNQEQREWMLKDFAREQFARRGMVADAVIHAPDAHGDQRNYHAHILLTMRKLDGDAFAKTKCRDWNSKSELEAWREDWAEKGARALERAGYPVEAARWQHGHQTLEEQRTAALERGDRAFAASLEHEATIHKGPKITGMERRGMDTDRMEALKDILARNDIRLEMKALEKELRPLEAIQADHAKAEQDRQREAALKDLSKSAQADPGKALSDPSSAAIEARPDKRDEKAAADQAAWRESVAARDPDKARPGEKALTVVNSATGAVSKLGDFMVDLLSGPSQPQQSAKPSMKEFLTNPAARAAHQRAGASSAREQDAGDLALERIHKDMLANRSLRMEDIRSLTREHQEAIRLRGDDGVRQLVDEARKRGDGRERE